MATERLQQFWELVKDVWNQGLYGIDIGRIVLAILIVTVFLLARNLFTRVVIRRFSIWARRSKTELDDSLLETLEPPIRFIPIVLGVFFATSFLAPDAQAASFFSNLNRSLVAFTIFWALYRAADPVALLLRHADSFLTSAMIDWLARSLKIAFTLLGGATILEVWGIEVGPIIAGLGLFGVAVALGAQDMFKNLIAGLFVIGERRFLPGDWILVDGVVEGTVEHIGFRTTMVRRFDKAPVYVPNAKLSDNAVTNFSRMTFRRIKWLVGLEYGSTAEQLQQVRDGIEHYLLANDAFVRPEDTATFVRIDHFADSSINILIYCFTRTTDWLEWLAVKEQLLLAIKRIVEDAGTGFAFPSRSLYLEAMPGEFEPAPVQLAPRQYNRDTAQ